MHTLARLLRAEGLKLRRSPALKLLWALPLLFLALDLSLATRSLRSQAQPTAAWLSSLPVASVQGYWAGFCHLLLITLLPPLLFRPEHQAQAWKHLDAQAPSPKLVFLAKALVLLLLMAACLGLLELGLWVEWSLRMELGPLRGFRFPWWNLARVLGWLYLGSLPLCALYLWLGERISSAAVPISFALIGLLLNIALAGNELDPSWRRDLIPWVLPYACAQNALDQTRTRQEAHVVGQLLQREEDLNPLNGVEVYYLPSGRKVTSYTSIPTYFLLPPPPTSKRTLALFSLGAGGVLLSLGLLAARRNRA